MEQCAGWLPEKCLVSTLTPRMTPRIPNAMTHQSCPAVRRLRDSQPSIHLPRDVNLPGMKIGGPGFTRLDFDAKKSSLAAIARPPTRDDARSASCEKAGIL
jgi:hypothetical protein